MPLRVLLADDHPLILWAWRHELERSGDFEIVGEVRTGSQVVPRAGQAAADVVLLDLGLPDVSGLECLVRLRARHPDIRVVICSASVDPADIAAAREAGAAGFVVKSVGRLRMVGKGYAVGERYQPNRMASPSVSSDPT